MSRRSALAAVLVLAAATGVASAQGFPGYGPMQGGGWGPGWQPYGWGLGGAWGGPGMTGPGMMGGGPAGGMMGAGPMGGMMGPGLAPVDADGDGLVSAEEASARAEAAFDRLDPDGDGKVTREEFLSMGPWGALGADPATAAHPMAARMAEVRQARFAELDADGDGILTRAEHFAAAEAAHGAADANGDGAVSVWEFRAAHRPF